MAPGTFRETHLDIRTFRDGSDDELKAPLHYRAKDGTEYRCPIGSKTDGMSLPKIVRMVPGFNAARQDWFPAILHDGGYRGTLQKWTGKEWIPAKLTRKQADLLMGEAMQTNRAKRVAVLAPLWAFGWWNFKPKA
jgi:hypothetical protein